MMKRPILPCALRLLFGAALAPFFALALALASSYLIGGWVPATILGVFLCASCEALLPVAALLFCILVGVRLAHTPNRAERGLDFLGKSFDPDPASSLTLAKETK